jgi:hypothetical protein
VRLGTSSEIAAPEAVASDTRHWNGVDPKIGSTGTLIASVAPLAESACGSARRRRGGDLEGRHVRVAADPDAHEVHVGPAAARVAAGVHGVAARVGDRHGRDRGGRHRSARLGRPSAPGQGGRGEGADED